MTILLEHYDTITSANRKKEKAIMRAIKELEKTAGREELREHKDLLALTLTNIAMLEEKLAQRKRQKIQTISQPRPKREDPPRGKGNQGELSRGSGSRRGRPYERAPNC